MGPDRAGRAFVLSMEKNNMRQFTWTAAVAATVAIVSSALGSRPAALAADKIPLAVASAQ
jgi:hypothetical protein